MSTGKKKQRSLARHFVTALVWENTSSHAHTVASLFIKFHPLKQDVHFIQRNGRQKE